MCAVFFLLRFFMNIDTFYDQRENDTIFSGRNFPLTNLGIQPINDSLLFVLILVLMDCSDYYSIHVCIVEGRLEKAGIRLASVLNRIFL